MSRLSQAERAAMRRDYHAYDPSSSLLPVTNGFSAAWSLGRDYMRERERALREAIEDAAGEASLCDSAEKLEALTNRFLAIAASPGESDGRRKNPHEFILWADHTWTGANEESDEIKNASLNVVPKVAQPDHGPGEPTELEQRQAAIDKVVKVMRDSEYIGGLSERDAWRTVMATLSPFATEPKAMQVGESNG